MKHGYENGVTTILGTANPRCDPFFLPRLPVNNWDDPRFFQAKLEGDMIGSIARNIYRS